MREKSKRATSNLAGFIDGNYVEKQYQQNIKIRETTQANEMKTNKKHTSECIKTAGVNIVP